MTTTTSSTRQLHVDIETYSSVDLKKGGVYRYAGSEDFQVLLLAFAFDDEPVRIVDLANGEPVPDYLDRALSDPAVIKIAHNASFERTCLARALKKPMPPEQWRCSMVQAYYCGLPGSLKKVGEALDIDQKKMASAGTRLINYWCKPDGNGKQRPAWANPSDWDLFKEYCKRDVEAEREIYDRLVSIRPVPPREWRLWFLDQKINDRGVRIDQELVDSVLILWDEYQDRLMEELKRTAPGTNPRSDLQFRQLLFEKGIDLPNLRGTTVEDIMAELPPDDEAWRLLHLRYELTRTALAKYQVFKNATLNGRIRGILQFYGAHTGRWSGRLIQPQNLPRPAYYEYDRIREMIKAQDLDGLSAAYDSVSDALSSVIRTVIIGDSQLSVADYSAIECRVIAWLADEQWVTDTFERGDDIYCETASQMFGVPVSKHGENAHLRSKGKVAVLACGYGGSVGALKAFGADRMGMSEREMLETVQKWRKANKRTVRLWQQTEKAARRAIITGQASEVAHGVFFESDGHNLFCTLPSGRSLVYCDARIEKSELGERITYTEKIRKETWGGKLVENIVQAIARDCLAGALLRLEAAGFPVVAHVHDEVIVESGDLDTICDIMAKPLPWARGLKLKAEGFTGPYYRKD